MKSIMVLGEHYTLAQAEKAIRAARLLVAAYEGGGVDGSIEWSDLDEAHEVAKEVFEPAEPQLKVSMAPACDTEGGSAD